ncbi:MAG: hypothetical protein INR64_04850 [Caulobacteraceae bacterium]|nr:hypothetical protein [Caulobacter sp.]
MTTKTLAVLGVAFVALGACSKKPVTSDATSSSTTTATASAPAAPAQHVRGVVRAVKPGALDVQTYDGRAVTAPVDAKTAYAWVEPSSLSSLKTGDFIGTATTGPDDALRAVEVVIFPASMRGTGEGHYPWDTPGAVAAKGGSENGASGMTNGTVRSQSGMTNGTVQAQSGMTNGTIQSQSGMTNGTVTAGAGGSGAQTLTISYKGGTSKVLVPADAPVVRFDPTAASSLAKGQKVFVVSPTEGAPAKFVAIGKNGLTPPM